jgi:NOL1/NOP2/sun family putative RNA methylase
VFLSTFASMSNIFPPAFVRSLNEKFNLEESDFFQIHEKAEQITSIRLNPFKPITEYNSSPEVPWCKTGRYLVERPSFIADPLFHAGCYYVQEASSMFLHHVLNQTSDLNENLRVLDLCAAPGGKSTLISSLLNNDSLLVSNEIIKTRVSVLSENLTKWGILNSVVTNNDPKDFARLESYFDVMVIDAPCSGSGMFRKDPAAINEWSEGAVQLCSQRQQRILADSYSSLANGGILIYSTCSYSSEENEEIADWLCDNFSLTTIQIPVDQTWGIVETMSDKHKCYGYRFYPHKVKGEGFFICAFIKNDGNSKFRANRYKTEKIPNGVNETINKWVKPGQDYWMIPVKEGYSVINKSHQADIQFLQSKLYLKKAGVFAGKIAKKDLIPDQALAQSTILNEGLQKVHLSLKEAIAYLRKDELNVNPDIQGWALMCFKDFGLGWAKILPNRINNYYPKELRILKEI